MHNILDFHNLAINKIIKNFRSFVYENCPEEYSRWGKFGQITWKRMKDNEILLEGLITSYPTTSVMSMLNNTYSDVVTHMQADPILSNKGSGNTSGISFYVSNQIANTQFRDELSENLKVYGYFIAFSEPYDEEIGFFIEPKFPFKLEQRYLKGRKVYHTTHKKYLPKIQKNGLVPKDSQTHFSHDGNRIYLMFSDNIDVMLGLKMTIGKSKGWKPSDMIILEIDPLPKIDIYIDPNFEDRDTYTSGFTFNNISPMNLKIVG